MRFKKTFVVFTQAALAVAALAVPASAHAGTISCAFDGVAGNVSPAVMLMGPTGHYDFATPAGSPGTQCSRAVGVWETSTISSVGQYDNYICGTGTAWSGFQDTLPTDQTTVNLSGGTAEIVSAEYTIDFRAMQGTLRIHEVNGRPELGGDDVDGHITIIPRTGSCTTGVTAFEVAGAFHAEW